MTRPSRGFFNKMLRFDLLVVFVFKTFWSLELGSCAIRQGGGVPQIEAAIATGGNQEVPLADPVPVYFTYITAWSTGDGVAHFRDDIYQRDGVDALAIGTQAGGDAALALRPSQ